MLALVFIIIVGLLVLHSASLTDGFASDQRQKTWGSLLGNELVRVLVPFWCQLLKFASILVPAFEFRLHFNFILVPAFEFWLPFGLFGSSP